MAIEIHVAVPASVVAAASRALKRAGVKDSKDRRKLRALLHKWAQAGLIKVTGEANVIEQRAAAVDRINARDVDALLRRARQDPRFRQAEADFVAYRDRDRSRELAAQAAAEAALNRVACELGNKGPLLALALQRMVDDVDVELGKDRAASSDAVNDHVLEERP